MSWLSGIGAGFRAIFGVGSKGSDNVMEVAKGVGNWIDEQQLTDEERIKYHGKMVEQFGGFVAKTIDENTERSRTRRDIAIWVIRFEIFLLGFSVAMFKLDPAWAAYAFKVATAHPLNYLVLGVGAFFFGAHIIRTYQGKPKKDE